MMNTQTFRRPSRRRWGPLALALSAMLVLAACGADEDAAVEEPDAPEPVEEPDATEEPDAPEPVEYEEMTIRVGGGPFISQAALLIADARGYLDAVGLNMEFSEFIDGGVVVSGVVGGDLDIGAIGFGASFFNSVAGGAPLTPILSRSTELEGYETAATLVTQELYDEGIQSIDDLGQLEGRNVAVSGTGALNQYSVARQMVEIGADPENVNWMTGMGQPDIVQLLASGDAEAANLASHFALMAEQQGAGIVIARGAVEENSQIGGIAVRTDFLEANRDAVVRFAMAYVQGARDWEQAMLDPEGNVDTIQIIVDGTTIQDVEFMMELHPHWSWIPPDAQINIDSVMAQQQFWIDHFGLIENPIDESQAWDDSVRLEAIERLETERPFE